jgi:hypothetical protein
MAALAQPEHASLQPGLGGVDFIELAPRVAFEAFQQFADRAGDRLLSDLTALVCGECLQFVIGRGDASGESEARPRQSIPELIEQSVGCQRTGSHGVFPFRASPMRNGHFTQEWLGAPRMPEASRANSAVCARMR